MSSCAPASRGRRQRLESAMRLLSLARTPASVLSPFRRLRACPRRRRRPGSEPARDRDPGVVRGDPSRLPRRRARRGEGRQARDGLLRPGRLPLLHAADEDELLAAAHRREDPQALRRHRAQHLGRPGSHLGRRPHDEREGARARAQDPVHADPAVPRREGRDRRAGQRLLSAAPLRGGARLRRRQDGIEAAVRRAHAGGGARYRESGARRRAVLPEAALRPAPQARARSRSR